jgi:hypothetical protein
MNLSLTQITPAILELSVLKCLTLQISSQGNLKIHLRAHYIISIPQPQL